MPRQKFGIAMSMIIAAFAWIGPVVEDAAAIDIDKQREMVNQGVIGVLGDDARNSDFALIAELATVLDSGYELRILPMAGSGSVRAIEDLLLLRGVDAAIVQADVLDFYIQAELYPDIVDKVAYLLKLYDREFHILASRDVGSIEDLRGQKVNFGPPSSGSYLTASLVFDALDITVDAMDDDHQIALDKLNQGEIAALVIVDAKPSPVLDELPFSEALRLLTIPAAAVTDRYSRTTLTSNDYPDLIEGDDTIETLAVPNVMAVYQWSKQNEKWSQINDLFGAMVNGLKRLRAPPFHKKWQEVDPTADVDGWVRF